MRLGLIFVIILIVVMLGVRMLRSRGSGDR
jgi:hypothetical protein